VGVTIQRRGTWWWLDISQDGKRFRKPTHTQEKRKAELIRHELESAILAGEWNVALALDTTLARGIERFQVEYEPIHHAPSTRKYSRKCFERFLGFITARRRGDVPMDLIGKSDIEAYQMDRSRYYAPERAGVRVDCEPGRPGAVDAVQMGQIRRHLPQERL